MRTTSASASLRALALAVFLLLVILWHDGFDLRGAPLNEHGMAPDIFALHLPRGLEELIAVAEADEAEAFALCGPLVTHDSGFLDGWPARECFQEGLVGYFACEVADEDAEVGGVPFEEGGVGPLRAAAGANYCCLFAIRAADHGCYASVGVDG